MSTVVTGIVLTQLVLKITLNADNIDKRRRLDHCVKMRHNKTSAVAEFCAVKLYIFSLLKTGYHTKVKEPKLPYYLHHS